MFGALALIVIGLLLLLHNLGLVPIANLKELVSTWWPLILIVAGVSMVISRWRRSR